MPMEDMVVHPAKTLSAKKFKGRAREADPHADSRKDRTFCYNIFMDPRPEHTEEHLATCKGFVYGDNTLSSQRR